MARLDGRERSYLLRVAREAVVRAVTRPHAPDRSAEESPPAEELPPTEELQRHRGAFVSLKRRTTPGGAEELRGCVGRIVSGEPLCSTVADVALAAALRDPRFPALTTAELPGLRIEVSALEPLQQVDGPESIVVGRDGVQLRKGEAQAVFLPQVGAERGWTTEQLLQHLARKAGLDRDGWIGAELSVFEAEVFAEPPEDVRG